MKEYWINVYYDMDNKNLRYVIVHVSLAQAKYHQSGDILYRIHVRLK